MKEWFVYILETSNGRLYTGITTDMERRFQEHSSGKKGAKFFRTTAPLRVLYLEKLRSRSEALKREFQIKNLSRPQKLHLIQEVRIVQGKIPESDPQV